MAVRAGHAVARVSGPEIVATGLVRKNVLEAGSGQCVAFSSCGRSYAVDIMSVQEIRSWSQTTPVPGQHPASNGVMDIRGGVIEVYDLGALFGAGHTEPTDGHVILVLKLGDATVGILVDAVSDIIQIEREDLQPPPGNIETRMRDVVRGIVTRGDQMVALLDLGPAIGSFD